MQNKKDFLKKYKYWSREKLIQESLDDLREYMKQLEAEHKRLIKIRDLEDSQFIAREASVCKQAILTLEKYNK